ncbi:hypothetical protein ACVWWG_005222 [Bradyrhizobium sp. LB7.2]
MTLRATIWGWDQLKVTSTEKIVLLDLCDRANHDNVCWPKQKTIAARTRLTERTVCTALAKLETLKLIHRRPRVINSKRTSDWITLLIRPPEPPPAAAPPVGPPPADTPSHPTPKNEAVSGDHQNVVQVPTGTSFSVIYEDEAPRQKQTTAHFLEPFPEPGRPDLEAMTHAARTIEEIAMELGSAIDWSAPGINNLAPVVTWLTQFNEREVQACLIKVARRVGDGARIGSWKYFEAEILNSCRAGQGDG